MAESDAELESQINKRLSLNLLIQGCAQHAFLTSHHLVRDELNAIDPQLLPLYDKFAIAGFAQYWHGASVLFMGRPTRFWQRTNEWSHPFRRHPLLARHGLALSNAARDRARKRAREKGVMLWPILFGVQVVRVAKRITRLEAPHLDELMGLARELTHEIWKIPRNQLIACITRDVAFGPLRPSKRFRAAVIRASAIGYGGVLWYDDQLKVVARGWNWPIISHELVKGTAELICLHGLSSLDDATCKKVLRAADRVEYEPWMLPTGAELWRRILALLPREASLAHVLMHMSQLPPSALHALLMAVMEDPEWARELLEQLGS